MTSLLAAAITVTALAGIWAAFGRREAPEPRLLPISRDEERGRQRRN